MAKQLLKIKLSPIKSGIIEKFKQPYGRKNGKNQAHDRGR
jgi:hypothetical protein